MIREYFIQALHESKGEIILKRELESHLNGIMEADSGGPKMCDSAHIVALFLKYRQIQCLCG